ncbi:MAG: glycosyltransferase family 4 protein, partial [Bacteroidales bacterium]|nr:glycosyltransferase family 4 protein [Bacteroidales bacterium]
IYMSSTAVNEDLIENLNENFLEKKYLNSNSQISLLYLARIEKTKGIYELINTYEILKNKYKNINLIIAGDGLEEENIKHLVRKKNLKDIEFLGFVNDASKISVFRNSHIYVFPSYSEGMPTSVLEAMACGLPVITTAVGGLVDFFESNTHGFMLDTPPNKNDFVKSIEILLNDKSLMFNISLNNHKYALNNFLASKIAKENINICKEVINS